LIGTAASSLNERTTGDKRPDIAARLAKANHETLLTVTEAKDAMRAAARADYAAQRQAERAIRRVRLRRLNRKSYGPTGWRTSAAASPPSAIKPELPSCA
jgi:hypothetical protein